MTTDMTNSVMDGVKKYERRRTGKWIVAHGLIILSLVILALILLFLAFNQIFEFGTMDLLWGDIRENIEVIWAELPIENLGWGLGLVGVVGLGMWFGRRRLSIVINRLKYLTK